MSETNNTLEILVNLIYLAAHSCDDPQVTKYLRQANVQVMKLAETSRIHAGPRHD